MCKVFHIVPKFTQEYFWVNFGTFYRVFPDFFLRRLKGEGQGIALMK